MIRVGCCGFPEAHYKYFQRFKLVEIQKTFYQPPKLGTARKWRDNAPEDFVFTLKAWQLITHTPSSPTYRRLKTPIPYRQRSRYGAFRPTREVFQAWQTTRAFAEALEAEAVVFQCPSSFRPTQENIKNLRKFFSSMEAGPFTLVWEPRGGWEEATVRALCEELDLVHGVDPFQAEPVTEGLAYFRLHGIKGYRYNYTDENLQQLKETCSQHEDVYCLFNNISMLNDAVRFQQLIKT